MKLANIRYYLSQLNWLVVVFTLLVFSGLIKLGFWQNARALEKEQRIAHITQLQSQQAISLTQIILLQQNHENINDMPVELDGTFEKEKVFLLDNQTFKGRLGYRALQVMTVGQFSVMVNLGWIEGFIDRSKLPNVSALQGTYKLQGHIRLIEQGFSLAEQHFKDESWPLRIQQVDLDKISQLIAQKLLPFVVYLDKKETVGFEKNWHPIVMPPEKHRAYAFQWFSLACAWLTLMIWAGIRFSKNND